MSDPVSYILSIPGFIGVAWHVYDLWKDRPKLELTDMKGHHRVEDEYTLTTFTVYLIAHNRGSKNTTVYKAELTLFPSSPNPKTMTYPFSTGQAVYSDSSEKIQLRFVLEDSKLTDKTIPARLMLRHTHGSLAVGLQSEYEE